MKLGPVNLFKAGTSYPWAATKMRLRPATQREDTPERRVSNRFSGAYLFSPVLQDLHREGVGRRLLSWRADSGRAAGSAACRLFSAAKAALLGNSRQQDQIC